MDFVLSLGQTALELGLICSLTVLALFLSYTMLNVCDLSTDGCFTLGQPSGLRWRWRATHGCPSRRPWRRASVPAF